MSSPPLRCRHHLYPATCSRCHHQVSRMFVNCLLVPPIAVVLHNEAPAAMPQASRRSGARPQSPTPEHHLMPEHHSAPPIHKALSAVVQRSLASSLFLRATISRAHALSVANSHCSPHRSATALHLGFGWRAASRPLIGQEDPGICHQPFRYLASPLMARDTRRSHFCRGWTRDEHTGRASLP